VRKAAISGGSIRSPVGVEDARCHALARPGVEVFLAPGLLQLRDREPHVGAGEGRGLGALHLRYGRPWASEAEPEDPRVGLVVSRVEGVPVALAVDGQARRPAPRQRQERLVGIRDPRPSEAPGHLPERHGPAALEKGDDQQREGVRFRVPRELLEHGDVDAEHVAVFVRHGRVSDLVLTWAAVALTFERVKGPSDRLDLVRLLP
jgi:hypothetical protein